MSDHLSRRGRAALVRRQCGHDEEILLGNCNDAVFAQAVERESAGTCRPCRDRALRRQAGAAVAAAPERVRAAHAGLWEDQQ